jgi:hypothetical protein
LAPCCGNAQGTSAHEQLDELRVSRTLTLLATTIGVM